MDPTSQVASILPAQKLQEWCINSPATAVTLPSNVGDIIWQTAANITGPYNTIAGQTGITLPSGSIPTSIAGILYYRAVVTSGVCPSINSDTVKVTTDAATVAGTITSTSVEICNRSTPPTITLSGNVGSNITWQYSTDGSTYTNTVPSQTGTSISSVLNNLAPRQVRR